MGSWQVPADARAGGLLGLTISVRPNRVLCGRTGGYPLLSQSDRERGLRCEARTLSALLTSFSSKLGPTSGLIQRPVLAQSYRRDGVRNIPGAVRRDGAHGRSAAVALLPNSRFARIGRAVLLFLVGLPYIIRRARSGLTIAWGVAGYSSCGPRRSSWASRAHEYPPHMLFVLPPHAHLVRSWPGRRVAACQEFGWGTATVLLAMLAPGILGIIAMHPYTEYAYSNSFIRGVSGADGRFETIDGVPHIEKLSAWSMK